MKTSLHILFVLYFSFQSVIAQNWQWANGAGGTSLDAPSFQMLCIDNSGSNYYCGTFSSNPCYFHTDTLTPTGLYDMFIAKYDANGNEMWVKGLGGNNQTAMQQERIISMCYNNFTNSILISALFYGIVIVGNDTLYGSSSGNFCASIDTSGNINWVNQTNGFLRLATEGDNYFYGMIGLSGLGMMLAKYNVQGDLIWTKKIFDANGTVHGFDAWFENIRIKHGKIFGFGSCTVDTFITDTITVHANFPSDQYVIACFDTSGSALWVKPTSGKNSHFISDIEVDDNLNSYITGPVQGDAIFDGDTIHTVGSGFLAKYDSSGNFIWVNHDANIGQGMDLAIDNENTIYIIESVFDTAYLCNSIITSAVAGDNSLLVRYDSNGSCISYFKSSNIGISSVQCDSNNSVIITGAFFNTITLGNSTITCLGTANSYIAKMDALTGIGEGERKTNTLLIYANPNDGKCNITIPDEFRHEKKLVLSIFDNSGKLIQQGNVAMNEDKVRVNLEAAAKGIYNVTLSNGSKTYTGKIIFE